LNAALADANFANRAKTDFLANISHELRTPLNAIIGFSEMLTTGISGPLSEQQHEYAGDIRQSSLHLLSVIDDILDLSKIEANAVTIHSEPVEIREAAESALRLVADRDTLANVEISSEIPDELPLLNTDIRLLKQILINLLSNAVKFTPDGGKICVKAAAGPTAGFSISVVDNGIGMRDGDIPTALAKFGQIDLGLDRKNTGTGLGLPLVAEHTRLHGGALHIESQPGARTTATVQFPPERTVSSPKVWARRSVGVRQHGGVISAY
jgi:signal transduction histidine kinase